MASEEESSTTQTATETATETTTDRPEEEVDVLTAREEQVVRMRRGLSKDDDEELEFAAGADSEAREQMKRLEAFLVEEFQERESGRSYFSEADADSQDEQSEVKEKIVQRLRESDE